MKRKLVSALVVGFTLSQITLVVYPHSKPNLYDEAMSNCEKVATPEQVCKITAIPLTIRLDKVKGG